jgi:hypothetical protein
VSPQNRRRPETSSVDLSEAVRRTEEAIKKLEAGRVSPVVARAVAELLKAEVAHRALAAQILRPASRRPSDGSKRERAPGSGGCLPGSESREVAEENRGHTDGVRRN